MQKQIFQFQQIDGRFQISKIYLSFRKGDEYEYFVMNKYFATIKYIVEDRKVERQRDRQVDIEDVFGFPTN